MQVMKHTMRIGICGLGAMGTQHAALLSRGEAENIQLCAMADPGDRAAALAKEQFPDIPFFKSTEDMINSGLIDAVILSTPPHLHAEQASYALDHGLHVIVEKPIGLHVAEARKLLKKAKAKNLVYAMAMNQRYNPFHRRIHDVLASGELGKIHRVLYIATNCYRPLCYYHSAAWRATWQYEGGGMLINQNAHALDALLWWLGAPEAVSAHLGFGKFHSTISVEDETNICLLYPDGSTCNFISTTGDYPGSSMLEIHGDQGKLWLQGDRLMIEKLDTPCSVFSAQSRNGFAHPESTCSDITPQSSINPHVEVLKDFANQVLHQPSSYIDAEEGIRALELAHTIYSAAQQQRTIFFPVSDDIYEAQWQQMIQQEKPREVMETTLDLSAAWAK